MAAGLGPGMEDLGVGGFWNGCWVIGGGGARSYAAGCLLLHALLYRKLWPWVPHFFLLFFLLLSDSTAEYHLMIKVALFLSPISCSEAREIRILWPSPQSGGAHDMQTMANVSWRL